MVSYMDDIDRLIAYWNQTKLNLVYALDVIDDALYRAYMAEADAVP
jgi:hypothetical protein